MFVVVLGITGLEASRAPYSKSHARRLKRREKEQLTGRLGSLKAALPSIAPTATTSSAAIVGERSAEEVDAATATTSTTVTAARSGATVKPTQQPTITAIPRPTRPGQIGEGNDAPLTKSQRRRALYGLIIANLFFFFAFATEATSFFLFLTLHRRKAERFRQPLIRSNPEFAANPFETIRTHARNTLVPHKPAT
jgi:hypothetical protein